jgi:serine/threonine-protein kinase
MGASHPRTLGRYLILEQIGGGAGLATYRAHDPYHDRTVVVRVAWAPARAAPEVREAFEARFLDEARRACGLSHPALVTTHACGRDDASGVLYVVQDDAAGVPLSRLLAVGEPPAAQSALRLISDVGNALHRLHAAGLVHGSVRPSNILVEDSGAARLADAGVARFEDAGSAPVDAQPASIVLYRSPEQMIGESADARSDLFALGAVGYRLLTGRDAFEAEDPRGIVERLVYERPRRPSTLAPELPKGVDALLARALAKSRKDRYADASALCADVADVLAGRPPRGASLPDGVDTDRFLRDAATSVEPSQATGRGSLRLRRRNTVRGLVGLAALGLVGGLELLRRSLEAPSVAPGKRPGSTATPALPGVTAPAESGLPSMEATPVPVARLALDFKHTLESGTLSVVVDGKLVSERRIAGTVKKSILGIKFREGRSRQVVEVPPGRRVVAVKVRWRDDERSETVSASFAAGTTRRLSAKLGRVGKPLSLKWE